MRLKSLIDVLICKLHYGFGGFRHLTLSRQMRGVISHPGGHQKSYLQLHSSKNIRPSLSSTHAQPTRERMETACCIGYGSPPGSSFLPIRNRLSPAGSNPSPGARSAGHLVRLSLSPASSSLSSHLEPLGYGLGTCKYLAEYSLIYYSNLKLVLIIV